MVTPAGITLLKVNSRNTRTWCEICSKLTIQMSERRQWHCSNVFIQFVIFNPLSYCFEGTIGFDVKTSFASRPESRLIRWYNKRILIKVYSVPWDFSWIENYKLYCWLWTDSHLLLVLLNFEQVNDCYIIIMIIIMMTITIMKILTELTSQWI